MLDEVITALRARCPSFANRVAGAAEFNALPENGKLTVPSAYVLPLDDKPGDASTGTGYRQELRDSFGVVVALANDADLRGQKATADAVRVIRPELFKALLGWGPDDDHGPITYEGGQLQDMNRAVLWYRFEFGAETVIEQADTHTGQVIAAAPALESVTVTLDTVDHQDPALGPVNADGTPVAGATITIQQT